MRNAMSQGDNSAAAITVGARIGTGPNNNKQNSASSAIMERAQTATMKLQAQHRTERSQGLMKHATVAATAAPAALAGGDVDVVVGAVMGFLVSEALRLVQTLELDQGQTLESGELMSDQALNHDFLLNLTTLLEVKR